MHYAHIDAKEALDAFADLGARHFIPTQWGTFPLGDEPVGFGVLDLKKQIAEKRIDPGKVIIMDLGGIIILQR
jgi:L-ascorbate metabolism protein UlaG (beta-lactamase superfamily)